MAGQPMSPLCGSVWGRTWRGNKVTAWPLEFYPGESCLPALSLKLVTSISLHMHWCPSSCCLGAESQKEWVYISPKFIVCPLRGVPTVSRSFFPQFNPCCFLQPEVMGTYLPDAGLGNLDWVWDPFSCGILPNFYPPHVDVGPPILPLHASPHISALNLSYLSG